jgi:hypothetical protein
MREFGLDARHFEIYGRAASSGMNCIHESFYDGDIIDLLNSLSSSPSPAEKISCPSECYVQQGLVMYLASSVGITSDKDASTGEKVLHSWASSRPVPVFNA